MFEFHGWANILLPEEDEDKRKVIEGFGRTIKIDGPDDQVIKQVRSAMNEIHDEFSIFDVRRSSNAMIVFFTHGLRNHQYDPVIEMFEWIAKNLPDSYGLLYIHNDEDHREDYENRFRVWRLALGKLTEMDDPFLSPCIPTIELQLTG